MLLIFKKHLYKARQNKDLNFNILKNHLTKVKDLEANFKNNDKYNKKCSVISNVLPCYCQFCTIETDIPPFSFSETVQLLQNDVRNKFF